MLTTLMLLFVLTYMERVAQNVVAFVQDSLPANVVVFCQTSLPEILVKAVPLAVVVAFLLYECVVGWRWMRQAKGRLHELRRGRVHDEESKRQVKANMTYRKRIDLIQREEHEKIEEDCKKRMAEAHKNASTCTSNQILEQEREEVERYKQMQVNGLSEVYKRQQLALEESEQRLGKQLKEKKARWADELKQFLKESEAFGAAMWLHVLSRIIPFVIEGGAAGLREDLQTEREELKGYLEDNKK